MVSIKNILKKYGNTNILTDISLEADKGEAICIIGRNGCGKSTLLRILSGVLKADSGMLLYNGINPLKNKNSFKSLCGYIPQTNPLIDELSVYDNLLLWGNKLYVEKIINRYDLSLISKKSVKNLSGGMKRRVSIACALIENPPILIMDEPSAALDIYYKKYIEEIICEYKKAGKTVIIATHDINEIMLCDKIYVLEYGRLIRLNRSNNLKDDIINTIAFKDTNSEDTNNGNRS